MVPGNPSKVCSMHSFQSTLLSKLKKKEGNKQTDDRRWGMMMKSYRDLKVVPTGIAMGPNLGSDSVSFGL